MSTTPDTPTLRLGSKGPAVLRLQTRLHDLGWLKPKPDGAFGIITYDAVLDFQEVKGLTADGIVGPATWAALQPPAKVVPPAAKPATGPGFADWLVNIAKRDVGKEETPRNNQGAWIKRFWPSTSYPEGYADRQPYCGQLWPFGWTRQATS